MKTNPTTLRSLLGSLLTSNLSDGDLRQIIRDLRYGTLADDLAFALLNVLGETKLPGSAAENSSRRNDSSVLRAEAAVKRRRLSKATLLDMMRESGGLDPSASLPTKASVYENLVTFFDSAPQAAASRFLKALEGPDTPDAYLKGISNRS
ncbi:MAG: hypothetical protein KYX67_12445 [Brevundimonas sp.]|uniref:hypothetical protein n=1 Tax=Brevundimonas sp. TaxID=1871086 RepID=UPI0025631D9A|nr:hypothetical protein [Brevundimonas sp.]MDK2748121.1 hypothetical protein [Brevundimonas sp.]